MKNHPDTLVAYVKYFGKVAGNAVTANMKSIDSQGMDLSYKLKNGEVGSVRIKFDPPLASYDEVKPRLLAMKADAQEGLGMLQTPVITTFRIPFTSIVLTNLPLVAIVATVKLLPSGITDAISFGPARALINLLSFEPTLKGVIQFVAVVHALESVYTWYLCRRHVKDPFVTAEYVAATMVIGQPIWSDLRKRVQEQRIASVMKAE
jgi:hypothetical protein